MAVNSVRPTRQVLATIHLSRPQMLLERFALCHADNIGQTLYIASFFIEKSCTLVQQVADLCRFFRCALAMKRIWRPLAMSGSCETPLVVRLPVHGADAVQKTRLHLIKNFRI